MKSLLRSISVIFTLLLLLLLLCACKETEPAAPLGSEAASSVSSEASEASEFSSEPIPETRVLSFNGMQYDLLAGENDLDALLPTELEGRDENDEICMIPVLEWRQIAPEEPVYDGKTEGEYVFAPVIGELPPYTEIAEEGLPNYGINIRLISILTANIDDIKIIAGEEPTFPTMIKGMDYEENVYEITDFTYDADKADLTDDGTHTIPITLGGLYRFSGEELAFRVKVTHAEPVKIKIPDTKIEVSYGTKSPLDSEYTAYDKYGNSMSVDVSWSCKEYQPYVPGSYTFSGRVKGYSSLSVIDVEVTVSKANVSLKYVDPKWAGATASTIKRSITVKNGTNSELTAHIEMNEDGEWVSKAEYTAKTGTKTLDITLPDDWKAHSESEWRIAIRRENGPLLAENRFTVVCESEAYSAPDGYYVPNYEEAPTFDASYDLTYGCLGLKVYRVQRALKISPIYGYYYEKTIDKVKSFQSSHGLKKTGNVDLETWLALGLDKQEWYTLGSYVTPVKTEPGYTRSQIIDTFIATARSYLGTMYLSGASGKPGDAVDCSGLVMQCLYSIGIYPDVANPVQHSLEEEYDSLVLWQDPKLKKVSADELQIGDLVFYDKKKDSTRPIDHIAIYIGNGKCIEAYNKTEILNLDKTSYGYSIVGYKRVIA